MIVCPFDGGNPSISFHRKPPKGYMVVGFVLSPTPIVIETLLGWHDTSMRPSFVSLIYQSKKDVSLKQQTKQIKASQSMK